MSESHRMSKARTRLLLDSPWFGALAMRLDVIEENSQPTFCTDGTVLLYNSEFSKTLTDAELTGVLAHEVMHCALKHPYRRQNRNPKMFNIACDHVINLILSECGVTLPADKVMDVRFKGMSSEQVYAILEAEQPDDGGGGGDGDGSGDGDDQGPATGSFEDAPGPGEKSQNGNTPMSEIDWDLAREQANMVAQKAGKMPGALKGMLSAEKEAQCDYREILRRFIVNNIPSDTTWNNPNRRHVYQGLYLPGVLKENIPKIVVAIDTSGSITPDLLEIFGSELTGIINDARPEEVHVIYCDTHVRHVDVFVPGDDIKLEIHGGGGTAFQPVFDYVEEQDIDPACLIYMTDTYGDSPKEPSYPTLWVVPEQYNAQGPFGETIPLSKWA